MQGESNTVFVLISIYNVKYQESKTGMFVLISVYVSFVLAGYWCYCLKVCKRTPPGYLSWQIVHKSWYLGERYKNILTQAKSKEKEIPWTKWELSTPHKEKTALENIIAENQKDLETLPSHCFPADWQHILKQIMKMKLGCVWIVQLVQIPGWTSGSILWTKPFYPTSNDNLLHQRL